MNKDRAYAYLLEEEKREWLPYINPEVILNISAHLTIYLITLEAWRRGLTVTFKGSRYYTITSNLNKILFKSSCALPKPEFNPTKITVNKDLSKEYFNIAKVPFPEGKCFQANINEKEMINYGKELGFPIVLKPNKGTRGKGVMANIKDEFELKDAISHLKKLGVSDVLLEKHITGDDYRIQVVGSKVVGAVKRIPANITGNGIDTIKKLIDNKNLLRGKNPYTRKSLIEIDKEVNDYVQSAGYNYESVPKLDELIYLRGNASVSRGADSIDVTDVISNEVKEIAVEATQSIPNLYIAGVDIVISKERDVKNPVVVLEINSVPQIALHVFPLKGFARNIPSEIIDYFFPDSCKNESDNKNLYYNYRNALYAVKNGVAKEITLKNPPSGKVITKKIMISGTIRSARFTIWAKKNALNLNLSGYLKKVEPRKLCILVCGNIDDVKKFIKKCSEGPRKDKIECLEVLECNDSVTMGFEVKDSGQKEKKLKEAQRILKATETDLKEIRTKYEKIKQSRIWRYTKPLRVFKKSLLRINKCY